MDINVKIYVNGKNYKTLCKTVINADTVQCEISFDNHSFDVEFDNTAITLKNIDGLKVDTVKTLRFKANFTSMKKFKWDLMEIVTDIVGLLADRHIGYKNMEELYDNAIKNHCIKPEATESETATEPETAETEETTDPEVGKFVYDVRIHNDYGWDTYTVAGDDVESAVYKALKRVEYECGKEECSSIDVIRIYKEDSNELLKEIISKEREDPETADQGETSESVTKQYECENVVQVAHKVADLTNTLCDRETWKGYCDEVKRDGSTWIDYTAFDTGGNEFDVSIFLGYDQQCRHYFVSVDYEKCPVPDMPGGA